MSLRGRATSLDAPDSGHRPICLSGCSNHSNTVIIMEAAQIDPGQTQCIYLFACTLASLLTCEDKQGSHLGFNEWEQLKRRTAPSF